MCVITEEKNMNKKDCPQSGKKRLKDFSDQPGTWTNASSKSRKKNVLASRGRVKQIEKEEMEKTERNDQGERERNKEGR